jgi:50S ribosomal subunit-associated GTPase HflX
MSTEPEKAVLIGVINDNQDIRLVNDYLEELAFLVETAGAIPVKKFIQAGFTQCPYLYWQRKAGRDPSVCPAGENRYRHF